MNPRQSPTTSLTVEQLISDALARSVEDLRGAEAGARAGDVAGVHDFRVATRRLRSDLQTFGDLLDPARVKPMRSTLRRIGGAAGEVRDLHVLHERLHASVRRAGAEPTLASVLLDHIYDESERHQGALVGAIEGKPWRRLMASADELIVRPPFAAGTKKDRRHPAATSAVLRRVVTRRWDTLADAVEALPNDPADDELHHVRILAKRCRYAVEAIGPAIGEDAAAFAKALAKLQGVLGDHQDAVFAAAYLAALPAVDESAVDESAVDESAVDESAVGLIDVLVAQEFLAQRHARVAWPRAWEKASRRKLRRWL